MLHTVLLLHTAFPTHHLGHKTVQEKFSARKRLLATDNSCKADLGSIYIFLIEFPFFLHMDILSIQLLHGKRRNISDPHWTTFLNIFFHFFQDLSNMFNIDEEGNTCL